MTDSEIESRIAECLRLPYHKVISGNSADGFRGEVAELPGCCTIAETASLALNQLEEAMAGWLEFTLRDGGTVPLPAARVTALSV
jgi:predicted RNase H-like HicB family nuclease